MQYTTSLNFLMSDPWFINNKILICSLRLQKYRGIHDKYFIDVAFDIIINLTLWPRVDFKCTIKKKS